MNLKKGLKHIGLGYLEEQLSTTINGLEPHITKSDKRRALRPDEDYCVSGDELNEADNEEFLEVLGGLTGLLQDLATLGLAVSYVCGYDSKLAKIAAIVAAGKIGTNLLSLAGQKIYKVYQNRKKEKGLDCMNGL